MKKLIYLSVFTVACVIQAFAQTPNPPKTDAPASTDAVGAEGKIACLNFAQFRDGITEMKNVTDGVLSEFEPKRAEMKVMDDKINQLKANLQTKSQTVTLGVRRQWTEDLAELEKVFTRKNEDYSQLGQKRLAEATQPVYDKIFKFMDIYCQRNGIALVIELGAAFESGTVIWKAPGVDITADFMKEFNKVNTVGTKTP